MRKLAAWAVMFDGLDNDDSNDELDGEGEDEPPAPKRTRRVFPRKDYGKSEWAVLLQCEDLGDPASKAAKAFRRRFRIPYPFFLELVRLAKRNKLFPTAEKDAVGRQCVPTELKVSRESLLDVPMCPNQCVRKCKDHLYFDIRTKTVLTFMDKMVVYSLRTLTYVQTVRTGISIGKDVLEYLQQV